MNIYFKHFTHYTVDKQESVQVFFHSRYNGHRKRTQTKRKGIYFGQNQGIYTLLGLTNTVLNTKWP